MRQKSGTRKSHGERVVKDIRSATRKQYSAEEKIRIVLDGLKVEDSIAELCRREGIAQSLYYNWSKEFLEAGKKRLAGDTARAASTTEVRDLRREAQELKEVVAEQTLELRLDWIAGKPDGNYRDSWISRHIDRHRLFHEVARRWFCSRCRWIWQARFSDHRCGSRTAWRDHDRRHLCCTCGWIDRQRDSRSGSAAFVFGAYFDSTCQHGARAIGSAFSTKLS